MFRKALLERLKLPFECFSPEIDESPLPDEKGEAMVARLSEEKALKASTLYSDTLCIGCDTTAVLGNEILGKPLDFEDAVSQWQHMSGQEITFLSYFYLLVSVFRPTKTSKEIVKLVSVYVSSIYSLYLRLSKIRY